MSNAPKPQAPLDVDALLDELTSAHIDDETAEIDAMISALEQIHAQLTRDLNQARA